MKENNQATPLISTKLYSVFHLVVLIFPDGFAAGTCFHKPFAASQEAD